MQPGDVILVRSNGVVGRGIRDVTNSRVNHVRWVVSTTGRVLEANPDGATYGKAQRGDILVSIPLDDRQRLLVPSVAQGMAGTPYAFLDVGALGLAQLGLTLPSVRRRVERPDRLFCSQLADLGLCRVGFHAFTDGRTHQNVSPGDFFERAARAGWPMREL